jgi:hypothetical protein
VIEIITKIGLKINAGSRGMDVKRAFGIQQAVAQIPFNGH